MASRERKRAERRKRKQRSLERRQELSARMEERAARTEARNAEAREALEPLAEDERPTVVTVAAAISAALALGTVVAYAAGLEVTQVDATVGETGESRPALFPTLASTALLGIMAWGLWKARYWAALGFQTLLVLVIVVAVLGLLGVDEPLRALGFVAVLALAGALFYRMVKAMARIQMPERRSFGDP
jgi:hypothetical protein